MRKFICLIVVICLMSVLPIGQAFSAESTANPEGNSVLNSDTGDGCIKINEDDCNNVKVSGNWIYYINSGDGYKMYRVKTDGSMKTRLSEDRIQGYTVSGDWIFYSNWDDVSSIYKMKTDGSLRTKICSESAVFDLIAADGWIYFMNINDNFKIYKVKPDGAEKTKICDDKPGIKFRISGDWIYYSNSQDGYKMYKIRKDGSMRTKVNEDWSFDFEVSGDWVYYTVNDNGLFKPYKIGVNGSLRTKLSDDSIESMTVDNDWIYFGDRKDGAFKKAKTDWSAKLKLSPFTPCFINIVGDTAYFANVSDGWKVYKMKTGGGIPEIQAPIVTGYVEGYDVKLTTGVKSIIVNNSQNDSDILVKINSVKGASSETIRVFYVKKGEKFKAGYLPSGNYVLYYKHLNTGYILKTENLFMSSRTKSIEITLNVQSGNLGTYSVPESEF